MPPKGFDCCGFAAYALGDDGRFHPVDLSQTVTLSADPDEEIACNGAHWEEGDPYHYKLVGDWELKAVMQCRYSARFMMKNTLPPRLFRRWVRKREKERRQKVKEAKAHENGVDY